MFAMRPYALGHLAAILDVLVTSPVPVWAGYIRVVSGCSGCGLVGARVDDADVRRSPIRAPDLQTRPPKFAGAASGPVGGKDCTVQPVRLHGRVRTSGDSKIAARFLMHACTERARD